MAQLTKKGLGRGFEALLPQNFDSSLLLAAEDRVQKLETSLITPDPEQPRRHFDEESLNQLAASIKRYGILQPLIVTPLEDNSYLLVAGERRWRAAQLAGLKTVPAIVRSHEQLERLEVALVENVQRVDLSPLEQAASIERLHDQFNLTFDTIAERLGKAVSTVNNTVRLLTLPQAARDALAEQRISEGHARAILAIKQNPAKQAELLELIIKKGWSVRQAERFVVALRTSSPVIKSKTIQEKISAETPATKALSHQLKAPVSIRRTARGGKLEIGFKSETDLNRLMEVLGGRVS